ncbi:MAG: radical SAM protein [Planctomycetaceae bacterium]|jgi:oxygen-independent coproporphyrinogen-3 oxidase|nr:radical SAM protein [Planctomycetaceae bacterium]
MGFFTSAFRIWLTRTWKPFEFTKSADTAFLYQNTEKLGLYVHIPFCRTLCNFCPYCKTVFEQESVNQYVEALLREIDMTGRMLNGEKQSCTSLYFGGGSPALLAGDIGKIIDRLRRFFIISDGIGIELHPNDVTEKNLFTLKQAGVTKISIGIQSFQKPYLEMLGRKPDDFHSLFSALAKISFETVSMDFIFALPNQSLETLTADIETAFSNGANHIAVYPFIDFTFTGRKFMKMREREKKRLLYQFVNYCHTKGYVRDSIWTFSKTGMSQYSSMTRENFLGFGCSATSLLKDRFRINTFDVQSYIDRLNSGQFPAALTLQFTHRQRMVYYLFWTAYSMRVNRSDFYRFFSEHLETCYGWELLLARFFGFIRKEKDDYVITTRGSYYYHYFEHFYTLAYIDRMWNIMRNEAFPENLIIR